MKKLVSIIIAMIILFSASVYAGGIPASAKKPAATTTSVKAKARKKNKPSFTWRENGTSIMVLY